MGLLTHFLSTGNSRRPEWKLYDLERDPGETTDVAADHPERFEQMTADAQKILQSVAKSAEGKDYPDGRVIQPPRHEKWAEMEAYKPYLATFEKQKGGASEDEPRGDGKKTREDKQ